MGLLTNYFKYLTNHWELLFDGCTAIGTHHEEDQSDQSMTLQADFFIKVMSRFIVIPLITS